MVESCGWRTEDTVPPGAKHRDEVVSGRKRFLVPLKRFDHEGAPEDRVVRRACLELAAGHGSEPRPVVGDEVRPADGAVRVRVAEAGNGGRPRGLERRDEPLRHLLVWEPVRLGDEDERRPRRAYPGRPADWEGERGFGLDQDRGGEACELVRRDTERLAGRGDQDDLDPVADRLCAQARERSRRSLEPVGREDRGHDWARLSRRYSSPRHDIASSGGGDGARTASPTARRDRARRATWTTHTSRARWSWAPTSGAIRPTASGRGGGRTASVAPTIVREGATA